MIIIIILLIICRLLFVQSMCYIGWLRYGLHEHNNMLQTSHHCGIQEVDTRQVGWPMHNCWEHTVVML